MVRDPVLFIWCIVAAVYGVVTIILAAYNWHDLRHPLVLLAGALCVGMMVFLLTTAVTW